jgi:uncharacterized protein
LLDQVILSPRTSRRTLLATAPLVGAVLGAGCGGRAAHSQENEPPVEMPPDQPAPETPAPVEPPPPQLPPPPAQGVPQAVFGELAVNLEVARTDAEHQKGLGGHAPLGERDGMIFVFQRPGLVAFWMKGMTFGLDIMWIEAGRVVHLEKNVPAPRPTDPDSALPILAPSAPATYVLEVNAGFSDKYGIARGSAVELRGV